MEIDSDTQTQLTSGGIVNGNLMKAENPDQPENQANVLFQPVGAAPVHDIQITENQSCLTEPAEKIAYDTDVDPNMMKANKIRCCMCGVLIVAVKGQTTCMNCLKAKIDITEGISRQINLAHCRECNRYLRPPWVHLQLESPELLSLCLKQMKGLKRVKLIDATFLWTEPHSKRLKVKVTVQKEIDTGASIQQTIVVEFVIENNQCDDCKKTYTPHHW